MGEFAPNQCRERVLPWTALSWTDTTEQRRLLGGGPKIRTSKKLMGIFIGREIQPGGGGYLTLSYLTVKWNLDVEVTHQCCGCTCAAKTGIGSGTLDAEG